MDLLPRDLEKQDPKEPAPRANIDMQSFRADLPGTVQEGLALFRKAWLRGQAISSATHSSARTRESRDCQR